MNNDRSNIATMISLGGALVATCIGSGFATGSEFISFSVAYGVKGALTSIIISYVIYFLFTKEMFTKGIKLPKGQENSLLSYYFGRKVGSIMDWYCAIFVGGCYLIMLSGAGATLHEYIGWPVLAGSAIMAVAAVLTVLLGLKKLTNIIGMIGPLMTVFTIVIGINALIKGHANLKIADQLLVNMNLHGAAPNAVIAGILYPCFAMLTFFPVLPAMGKSAQSKKNAVGAALVGSTLFHIALLILCFAILSNLAIVGEAQVPNLVLAKMMGPIVSKVFVVVIILAIFTTACPMLWGFTAKIVQNEKSNKYRMTVLLLTVVGMIASYLFPLRTLINTMYGISGYVGAVVAVGMIVSNIIHKYHSQEIVGEVRK